MRDDGQCMVKVMSSSAIKASFLELAPGFEQASGHTVVARWIPGVDLLQRIKDGEASDLVIMQASAIDELIAAGRLEAGSRTDIAKSGVGVAVRAGARKPDISSADALKRALLAASSVAYSTGPSGVYLAQLIQRLGLDRQVLAKARQVKGEPVGAVVARGEADIGFQQVSELLPVPGIDYIGPLPDEIQRVTVFSAALHVGSQNKATAKALVAYITGSAAKAALIKQGMEPA